MRVQFFKLNPSVRVNNGDSEPLGSSYKLEPTEALYLAKLLQKRETFLFDFTPLEIMPRCSAAGLPFKIIPAGFNAPLEFLTGFTYAEDQIPGVRVKVKMPVWSKGYAVGIRV